jgi:leucyl aminopeptidase
MQIECATKSPETMDGDVFVLGIDSNWKQSELIQRVDAAMNGWLKRAIESEQVSTKPFKITTVIQPSGLNYRVLVLVGLGEAAKIDAGIAYRSASAGAKAAATKKYQSCYFAGFSGDELTQRAAIVGSLTGSVGQRLFKKEPGLFPPERILWHNVDQRQLDRSRMIGDSVNFTRQLVNLPPNYIYPESFVETVVAEMAPLGIQCEVWDEDRLRAERCGSLLAVAQASEYPPRLLIMRYQGTNAEEKSTALVGKGVTFDSGGLSLKPSDSMLTMKCDMAGAATVAGIMRGIALLKPKKNVIGAVGLVENMIAGNAFRLGDVLTARSGKTIEVHNTDAEGRLVLADVLDVVCDMQPEKIVDFATLTGACVVALGTEVAGIMSNNDAWQTEIFNSAKQSGEYLWPLPMYDFFSEQIAGKVADIKNVGEGRWGGAMTAAKFLQEFVRDKPWAHLDIAGPAFLDAEKTWLDGGGTGVFVRTFIELLCR